jgi:hypothetical protein
MLHRTVINFLKAIIRIFFLDKFTAPKKFEKFFVSISYGNVEFAKDEIFP